MCKTEINCLQPGTTVDIVRKKITPKTGQGNKVERLIINTRTVLDIHGAAEVKYNLQLQGNISLDAGENADPNRFPVWWWFMIKNDRKRMINADA